MKNLLALAVLLIAASAFAQDSRGRQRNPGGGKPGGTQSGGRSGGSQPGGGSRGSSDAPRRDRPAYGGDSLPGSTYDGDSAPRSDSGVARRRVPHPVPRPDDSVFGRSSAPNAQPRAEGSLGRAVRRDSLPPRNHTDHFGGYVPHHPYDTGWNSYYWHTYNGRRYCHYRDAYGVSWYYWYYDDGYYVMRWHDGFWWRHDPVYGHWVYLHDGNWYYRSGAAVYLYEEDRSSYVSVDDGFNEPVVPAKLSLTASLGGFFLNEGSGVINENRGYLDFDGAMSGVSAGAEVNVGISNHVEAALGVGYQRAAVDTRYVNYVYENGADINQRLRLTNVPMNAHVKVMPWGRDQRIQPYLGAGLQVNKWNYQESGEFIDFASENWDIYRETYKAGGVAVGPVALVGLKVPLNNKVSIGGEYRHQWAKGDLPPEGGFAGDHIDLGGGAFQAGLTIKLK